MLRLKMPYVSIRNTAVTKQAYRHKNKSILIRSLHSVVYSAVQYDHLWCIHGMLTYPIFSSVITRRNCIHSICLLATF